MAVHLNIIQLVKKQSEGFVILHYKVFKYASLLSLWRFQMNELYFMHLLKNVANTKILCTVYNAYSKIQFQTIQVFSLVCIKLVNKCNFKCGGNQGIGYEIFGSLQIFAQKHCTVHDFGSFTVNITCILVLNFLETRKNFTTFYPYLL